MFYFVVLIEDQTKLCVPAAWICSLDIINGLKKGLNKNEKKRVFYSPDITATPNFLLPLHQIYNPNVCGCYLAKIKDIFATKDECEIAIGKYRGHLPPVYNKDRYRETTRAYIETEKVVAQHIDEEYTAKTKVKIEARRHSTVIVPRQQLPLICIDLTENDCDGKGGVNYADGAVNPRSVNSFDPLEGTSARARAEIYVSHGAKLDTEHTSDGSNNVFTQMKKTCHPMNRTVVLDPEGSTSHTRTENPNEEESFQHSQHVSSEAINDTFNTSCTALVKFRFSKYSLH